MEHTCADRYKDEQNEGELLHNCSSIQASADQSALYMSDSKVQTLIKGGKPGKTLILKLIQSETCENWFQELFHRRSRGLGVKIPKQVVSLDEKYLKHCLELMHMNALKGAPCSLSVNLGSLDLGFVSDHATVGRRSSLDVTSYAIDYPMAVGVGDLDLSPGDEEIVGSVMGSSSMMRILRSPLFQVPQVIFLLSLSSSSNNLLQPPSVEDPLPYDPHPSTPLPIPPLDHAHLLSSDFFPENSDDFNLGVDFDFTFDDLTFADDLLLEPQGDGVFDSDVSDVLEARNSGDSEIIVGNPNSRVYDCSSSEGVNHGGVSSEESNFGVKLNCASPESGSCKSNSGVSQTFRGDSGNNSDRDVSSSSFIENNIDDLSSKVKVEELGGNINNASKNAVSKRKKENDHEQIEEGKINKFRKSGMSENVSVDLVSVDGDDKKKARLMRNRESAQLSRQRKKQYVEELEDKVRSMHSTITDLNGKISYMMAENASLRQQLASGGGVCAAPPPPHGIYPMAPMPYPWMACPPYMVKPQGSHVPLVPIPRLKPQQPAPAPKVSRRSDSKKGEGRTKKVASVSLLGLLFCMLLFGGLVPLVNVKYGGIGFDGVQKGSVFMVDKHVGVPEGKRSSHGRIIQQPNSSDGFGPNGNFSEPLVASLYVPRNDKLVKIDGNLIIHSVLASEKAMASKTDEESKPSEETSLAIHGSYPPYPIPGPGSNNWRHPHLDRNQNGRQMALGSSSSEGFTPAGSDGKLLQWFREGLAGPMLSSGMCTEVFQFDISPTPGSIVPATSIVNVTSERRQNSTRANKPRNRRILHEPAVPLDGHTLNATEEHVAHEQNDGLQGNRTSSSMVVSVLVDPREVGDGDGEGVIRSKTMSRIFVVVLIDSVKYVTYSCMLPFLGSSNHLVTT